MSIKYYNTDGSEDLILYQWDIYQRLVITGAPDNQTFVVMLSNDPCEQAVSVEPEYDNGDLLVDIPNDLLAEYGSLSVHLCRIDDNNTVTTIDSVKIPIRSRLRPVYFPTNNADY